MIPGIQISSFRPLLSTPEGVAQVMAETARMGCTTVQLQWIDFSVPPEVIVREMERRGIRSVSTQDLFEVVQARLDYFIRLNRLSGGEWVCVSRIPPEYAGPAGLAEFVQQLERLEQRLAPEGLKLCFHPRAEDFAAADSVCPVDVLMQRWHGGALCLDLYHAYRAGLAPEAALRRWAGRVCMVHFKDYRPGPAGDMLTPAGSGVIPWDAALRACRETQVPYGFVEQETWDGDPFRCLGQAFAWLRAQTAG